MGRPSKLPEWDKNQINIVEDSGSRKDDGWLAPAGVPEKPPFQTFNWWQNLVYLWIKYFKESKVNTIAEMEAKVSPTDGDVVIVRDLNRGGRFIYDSTKVGDDNQLDNFTGWIRQYDYNKTIRMAGAIGDGGTDDSSAIQSAIDLVKVSSSNEILDCNNDNNLIDTGLTLNQGDCGIENLNVTTGVGFSSIDTDEAILKCRVGLRQKYRNIDFQCGGYSNGIWNETAGFHNEYSNVEIDSFKSDGFGMLIEGSGDQRLADSLISGESEVADRGTGICLHVNTGDFKLNDTVLRYSDVCLKVSGNTLHATGNHLYNGSAGSVDPATNSTNIEVDGGSGGSFCHTYLDKGRVVFRNDAHAAFFDTKLLFDSTPEHDSVFYLVTPTPNSEINDAFVFDGAKSTIPLSNGAMSFMTLNTEGLGTWSSETTTLKDEMNLRNNGYPRIVMQETCQLVAPSRSIICKGSEQIIKHSLGANTYSTNTSTGVNEIYRAAEVEFAAVGISHHINATGSFTDATAIVTGSRTGGTFASSIKLRNRKGLSTWDDTNGSYWGIDSIGTAAGTMDRLTIIAKKPTTTVEQPWLVLDYEGATVRPGNDNSIALGSATHRYTEVFAATGTINTSDERTKTFLDIETVEIECAKELKKMMRKFKFNDSIESKGKEKARVHFGVGAQSVVAKMQEFGLDPMSYSFICYDEWDDEWDDVLVKEAVYTEVINTYTEEVVITDESGENKKTIITKKIPEEKLLDEAIYEKVLTTKAGSAYGIRYEELLCFIIAGL